MESLILEVKDLNISFKIPEGKLNVIRGVSFFLEAGKTLAIVGESGSGKTVTVRAIMGILASNEVVESGKILFRNNNGKNKEIIDLLTLSKKQIVSQICGKKIAMVFQDPMGTLNPTIQIGKQVMEGMLKHQKLTKKEAFEKALKLLEEVGITEAEKRMRNYPHQLSGGMRQRVVIAIALACNPDVLICDEPTTALDVTIQAKILELIQNIQKQRNIGVIYITHDLGVVAKVADDVVVMYAGKIVEKGSVDDIFYNPLHPYTRGLLSSVPDIGYNDHELYSIPGSPPNLLEEIKGDAFAPRNPYALNIDYKYESPMFKITNTHSVASWLFHEKAPNIEVYPKLSERIQNELRVN
ncbi:ABC transporter ATP-binding protein [Clostridium sp. YIM B02555]|uniref:ABC transporter ATP-binding protein n=1 Tax=Clostridium sp. YIM B02555 TaxID=2911968 RepID=UPI001EEEBD59|nr:ABC transporter ATP-binding protein [Clostridium sp. YIM B02555]